jgi:hypothetical protein
MSERLNYEFKTNKNGKEYCHITNAKTGKFVRNVSSKVNLRTAHQSHAQQKRRAAQEAEWKSVEGEVTRRDGSRRQYEKAKRRLTKEDKDRVRTEKGAKPRRKRILQKIASEETGYTTTIKAFYQIGSTPKAQPYIVGESDSERDVDIEYSTWQSSMPGNNFKYNVEELRRDFNREIEDAETSELQMFYGGYEIRVIDNETGDTHRGIRNSDNGFY